MRRLSMQQIALITGASRGIGKAIAFELAKAGYHLSLCCHAKEEQLFQLATELKETYGVSVLCFCGDVGCFDFVEHMIQDTLLKYGQIDVLVNNAGISYVGLLTDMQPSDWENLLSTNLTSVFATCRNALPSMVARKTGKIINISSVWGLSGASCEVAYSATKGGVNAFTKALAKELAPSNIQVNAIACGVIDTDMNRCFSKEELSALAEEIPAGRMGQPGEVAAMVLSLCTAPSYLTGQIITLDGGWL